MRLADISFAVKRALLATLDKSEAAKQTIKLGLYGCRSQNSSAVKPPGEVRACHCDVLP